MSSEKEYRYYVIELMDPPSAMDVEKYVCVPNSWLRLREIADDDVAVVKFPIEKLSITKQRVKRREEHSDSWMIFVANVKYGTDSYKDAKSYIKILNNILIQEQSYTKMAETDPIQWTSAKETDKYNTTLETHDPTSSQAVRMIDAEPAINESEPQQPPLAGLDIEGYTNHSETDKTVNTNNKRYFTSQLRKSTAINILSQANNSVTSLHENEEETPNKSNDCNEDSINTKNTEDKQAKSCSNDNKQSANLSLEVQRQMINEQLVGKIKSLHKLSSIAESALLDQSFPKKFAEMSICINEGIKAKVIKDNSLNANHALTNELPESAMTKRPIFGEDFIGLMQDLYSQFDGCQILLNDLRNQYLENCSIAKKIIELANKINNLHVDSNIIPEKKVTNIVVEEKRNKSIAAVDEEENRGIEQPKKSQREEQKANNVVDIIEESNVMIDKNARKDGHDKMVKASNKIRGEANKFTLPPEYDANDSKWTLKHRKRQKDLVELMPHSGVYINAIRLSNCKRLSRDSKMLARMLMTEIFTENALSTCSLTGKRANAFYCGDLGLVRPGLDEHARVVLLNFVEQHAHDSKWIPLGTHAVVDSMRNKLQEMRCKSLQRKKSKVS